MNPYKILGVADGTSVDECKKAYRKLCKIYHPDSPNGDKEKFDLVAKAWSLIESGVPIVSFEIKRSNLRHKTLFTFA